MPEDPTTPPVLRSSFSDSSVEGPYEGPSTLFRFAVLSMVESKETPVFTHVVLLSFKPATSEEHLGEIVASLRGLPSAIPSIVSYRVGRDLGLAEDNFQIAVIAEFTDEASYIAYRDDPTHRAIIDDQIRPHLSARSASQFRT